MVIHILYCNIKWVIEIAPSVLVNSEKEVAANV